MKSVLLLMILLFCLTHTLSWNDGLWGRELRKRMRPNYDDEVMKLAEEIINRQHFLGIAAKKFAKKGKNEEAVKKQ